MTSKPFYQSTTMWINLLGVLVVVLKLVLNNNLIPDPDVVAIVVAILNIINRLLPQFTDRSTEIKPLKLM